MPGTLKKVRFKSPSPSSSSSASLASFGHPVTMERTPTPPNPSDIEGPGTPTPGPKPLPIPLPMPAPTPAYTKEDLRTTLKAESKRMAAEEKKAAAEKRKKDKAAAKDAKKSPWQLEKERLEAETKVRLKEIEAAHKQAKAKEKAAKKAEQRAKKKAGGGGFSLFGCFRSRGCGCDKECGCHCATPPTPAKGGKDELSYTYYPKYEPINQPTPDYRAWKKGPGPLLTQHLVYSPPRAEEAARLHSRLSGRNISVHYPVLPSLKEYEGVCEPWRRYEGWNGYGWEGDSIGDPKKPEKQGPPSQKPEGQAGVGKQQQGAKGAKGAKGANAGVVPKSPKVAADAKPPESKVTDNAGSTTASEDGGSRPTTPSEGAPKSQAKGILKSASVSQKGNSGDGAQQGKGEARRRLR